MQGEFEGGPLGAVPVAAAEAAAALEALKAPAQKAAGAIEEAFGKAGNSLSRSLMRAAKDGEVSLAELARALVAAVNAGMGQVLKGSGSGGLGDALSQAVGSVFSGARAEGGPVAAGGGYLVGERGPEVFWPSGSGNVQPVGGAVPVVVNVMVDGGPQALLRSEAQVARMLARAAALGGR